MGERDRVMLAILLGTGIRLSELVGLDLDGKRIRIHAKGGEHRDTVPDQRLAATAAKVPAA